MKLLSEASFAKITQGEEECLRPIGAIPATIPQNEDESGALIETTAMKEAIANSPRIALTLFNLCWVNSNGTINVRRNHHNTLRVGSGIESIDFPITFRNDFVIAKRQEESKYVQIVQFVE